MPDAPNACRDAPDASPPVGIVVHDATPAPRRPPSVAFVWAGEEFAVPSLPFGRWKVRVA